MKKIAFIITVLFTFVVFTGCSANKQVHDKRYLRAVSINGDETKKVGYSFYAEDAKPVSVSGDNMEETRKSAELKCGKDIFTGHTELVILGNCDYREALEFLLNKWRVSPSCLIVYGGDECNTILNENDMEMLADSVRKATEQGNAPECDIVTVLAGLIRESDGTEIIRVGKKGIEGIYKIY